ncbi:Dedicator of cytokinesis protein 9 [Chionoecetes opilio]|uniref:Dedicator of cytokinesis protein 9 n=1 Tax=Chionoecetes opilio TaxID=41210 RepID=A0A8J4XP35_CHIOP|nr:Dedicator of cytokinesis protein 9 [Chionoecetes opilio]
MRLVDALESQNCRDEDSRVIHMKGGPHTGRWLALHILEGCDGWSSPVVAQAGFWIFMVTPVMIDFRLMLPPGALRLLVAVDGTMAERKFTRGLCKPGVAAQVRENVSQAVKATATQHSVAPRVTRTLQSLASVHLQEEITNPLVRQCLAAYSQDLTTIAHKYLPYSGSYLHLPRLPRVDDLKEQVYEVDTDIEQGDLNPKRGKCCFELQLSECGKSVMLSAESEADLEDWIDKLTRVIHADKPQDDSRSERGTTPPSSNYGTLRGLEHSLNPQLIKYAHETDFTIAQARREDRHQLFTCYPNLPRTESVDGSVELRDESLIWPYEEKFGSRFRILFENIKFRLQAPLDSGDGPLSQAVMSVTRPHSEVFLVIWIEKVLQGSISQTVEPYLKSMDLKSIQKLQRTIKTCCLRLGAYRMPFGWCARPLFKNSGSLDTESDFSPIYRSDEKKLSESEFIRQLSDFRKPEKMNKLTTIPGSVNVQIVPMEITLPNSLTPALEPVKPFPNPPTHEPTVEVQEFPCNHIDDIQPFVSYCNHLYVYPYTLNYENQKSFNRARNLVCCIELRDSDSEGATPLCAMYGRPGSGALITQMSTVVLHHSTVPEWGDEVKILLPHNLSSSHHLLFTFSHVAIEAAKVGKKDVPVETVVGYSWLPLTHKGRLVTDDQTLPVAAHLPAKYLSIEPLGLGKGFAGPEVRWVDNQKNVFRVSMRLVSTVLSSDQHLHNFFQSSSSLLPLSGSSGGASSPKSGQPIDIDTLKNLKALHALEVGTIIAFFPTLLNQLFGVLLNVGPDVATNVTRVMVHLIDQVYEAGRDDILNSYIKYVMSTSCHGRKTVHEELCHSISELLQPSNMDQTLINKILRHGQFFFAFIARSMALHLLTTARIKMVRNERFSEEYQSEVRSLVEVVTTHIIQRFKENPVEARAANTALAHFLKRCLSMMDRGYVFGLIKLYLEHFSPGDPIILHVYKFTLLRVVCSHEHFVPLNLPIFNTPLSPDAKKAKLRHGTDEFFLSPDFNSRHFLVGALLGELRVSLGEIAEVQQVAIGVLRDLLAKHSFDDRYLQSAQQGRIACLYFPIVTILLENIKRLSWPSAPSSVGSSQRRLDPRASSRARSGRSGAGSVDMSTYSTPSRKGSSRAEVSSLSGRGDSSYLAMIAGPGGLMAPHAALVNGRSSSSLESEDQLPSVANSDVLEEDIEEDDGEKSHSRNLSVAFAGESGPVRYDKLSPEQVRDLLLCFLHTLKNVPEAHLVSWWVTLTSEVLNHFLTLLHSRMSTATDSYSVSSHEGEGWLKALQEANLASEVSLIVLEALGNFTTHCRDILTSDGAEVIMQQVFGLHLLFLQLGQSENVMKHVFASIRAFINNFPRTLFQGDASLCGSLCFEMLKCCNSKLTNLRHEACAVLYLLMRSNYEFTRRTGINRVHLQVIISVSQLLGEIIGLNNSRFQESMALINSYATSDKAMNNTGFVSEVRDLTKRIRTVLVATAQMREHERDPEMLCDLQHSLAASYAATPELRTTWLQAMSKHHVKNGDLSEAAFCQLHIAALMAQYLRHQGEFPDGCQIFSIISDNIPKDESNLRLDAGLVDTVFTMDSLINQLELAGGMVERSERYELLGNLYRILIPIYEGRRNYPALVQCYSHLYQAYSCVVEVNTSQKRLLGRYYRVAFFGPAYFEDEAGKEYVYKEPKVTSLAEISERLYHQYCDKFGKEVMKMIMDSNPIFCSIFHLLCAIHLVSQPPHRLQHIKHLKH